MKTWENSKRCEEMPPKILSKTDSSRKKWWARSQTILWLGKFLYGHKRNCPSRKGIIILKAPRSLAPLLLFSLDANIRPALFLNQQAQGQACECLSLRQESEVVLLITCSFTCILALTLLWKSCGRNDQLHPVGSCPQLGGQREGQQPRFFFLKITPGAAVVAQRCDPWFMGSSLRSLQELWLYPISTGEPTQPWPGLRSSRGKEWICPAARRIATTKGFE